MNAADVSLAVDAANDAFQVIFIDFNSFYLNTQVVILNARYVTRVENLTVASFKSKESLILIFLQTLLIPYFFFKFQKTFTNNMDENIVLDRKTEKKIL